MKRRLGALAAIGVLACAPLRDARVALSAHPLVVGVDRARPCSPRGVAGRMTSAPRERWRIDTSVEEETLAIRPSGRPGSPPPSRALEGGPRRAHVIPSVAGEQLIGWSNTWTEGS